MSEKITFMKMLRDAESFLDKAGDKINSIIESMYYEFYNIKEDVGKDVDYLKGLRLFDRNISIILGNNYSLREGFYSYHIRECFLRTPDGEEFKVVSFPVEYYAGGGEYDYSNVLIPEDWLENGFENSITYRQYIDALILEGKKQKKKEAEEKIRVEAKSKKEELEKLKERIFKLEKEISE